jgi:hypothetical protein
MRNLSRVRAAFAVLIGLRIALGPYPRLAGQPDALFRPLGIFKLLPAMPPLAVIVVVQVVGVAAAVLAARSPRGRAPLVVAWLSLLFLAGLRTSLGKVLHNDTLMLIGTFPLLFDPPDEEGAGWSLDVGLAAVCLVYFFAGLAKLRHSGLAWVTGDNMRYVMLSAARSGKPAFPAIARAIGRHAAMSHLTAAFILGLELTFPLAYLVRRARPFYAAAVLLLHVGTWFTLGLDYWLWAATAGLLLLARAGHPVEPASARPPAAAAPTAASSPR